MDLADAVIAGQKSTGPQVPELRQGVVTQVSPLLVRVGSATTAVACNALGSYRGSVGDVVSVLVTVGDRLVLGGAATTAGPLGFHITRTSSDSPVGTGGAIDINFNNVVEQNWATFAGFTSGSAFPVPSGGGGWYAVSGGVYLGAAYSGVYCNVTVNNVAVAATPPTLTSDRAFPTGLHRLAAGDVLRLRMTNTSASTVTPTFYGGDVNTPVVPFLKAWRI